MRRNTVGGRALRSPLNPGWSVGQGMRGAGSSMYSAMPAMSKLGDSLIDKLSSEGLSKAGEQGGSFLGGLGSDALSNLAAGLGGAAASATTAAGGAGLGAIPVAGPFLAAAAEAAAPVLGFGSTVASKAAGLPLQAAGAAIGKAGAPILAKMLGRGAMGAAAEGMHGPGTLLSGGGEPGDTPMKQAAMFGSMPKFDLGSGDGKIPPPQAPMVKPLGDEALSPPGLKPAGGMNLWERSGDNEALRDQALSGPGFQGWDAHQEFDVPFWAKTRDTEDILKDKALSGPGVQGWDTREDGDEPSALIGDTAAIQKRGIDGVIGRAAKTDGQFKRPGTTTVGAPTITTPGVYTSPDGGMTVGPPTITTRPEGQYPKPVDVDMDAEPTTYAKPGQAQKPLDQFKTRAAKTIEDLLAGEEAPGRTRRRPASRIR